MKEFWCVKNSCDLYLTFDNQWLDKGYRNQFPRKIAYILVANLIDNDIVAKVVHVKKVPKKFKPGDKVWVKAEVYDSNFLIDADNYTLLHVPLTDIKRRKK